MTKYKTDKILASINIKEMKLNVTIGSDDADKNLYSLTPKLYKIYSEIPEIILFCAKTETQNALPMFRKILTQEFSEMDEAQFMIKKLKNETISHYNDIIQSGLKIDMNDEEDMLLKIRLYMEANNTWKIPLPKGYFYESYSPEPLGHIQAAISPIIKNYIIIKLSDKILELLKKYQAIEQDSNISQIEQFPSEYFFIQRTGNINREIRKIIIISRYEELKLKQLIEDWYNCHMDKKWFVLKLKEYSNFDIQDNDYLRKITKEESEVLNDFLSNHKIELETAKIDASPESRLEKIINTLSPLRGEFDSSDHIEKIASALIEYAKDKSFPAKTERLTFRGRVQDFYPYFFQLVEKGLVSRTDIKNVLPFYICNKRDGLHISPNTVYQNLKDFKSK